MLEVGSNAFGRVVQAGGELGPPEHSATRGHGPLEPLGCGQTLPGGAKQPGDRVVDGAGRGREIQHGLLDPGPRRQQDRMASRPGPVEPVHDGARDGLGAAVRWHDDVYRFARVLGQAGQPRCRAVAEHGIGPGAQYDRRQPGVPARLAAEGRVHAVLKTLPAAGTHQAIDGIAPEARL
jgi:hypothetical protein